MEPAIAGLTASLLTLFDLDRTFYIPLKTPRKVALYAWWWGFIIANGAIAAALDKIFGNIESLRALDPWLRAVLIGVSYLAIIRAKFTTFSYQGKDVPFGLEALYEGAKGFVYKRINSIAKAARYEETTEHAGKFDLAELASRAKLDIEQDQLLTPEDKIRAKAWILSVLKDDAANDFDKRAALADFILSGQRSSDFR